MIDPDKTAVPEADAPASQVDEELAREVARLLEEEGDFYRYRPKISGSAGYNPP